MSCRFHESRPAAGPLELGSLAPIPVFLKMPLPHHFRTTASFLAAPLVYFACTLRTFIPARQTHAQTHRAVAYESCKPHGTRRLELEPRCKGTRENRRKQAEFLPSAFLFYIGGKNSLETRANPRSLGSQPIRFGKSLPFRQRKAYLNKCAGAQQVSYGYGPQVATALP
jgi:hypothetical protein